MEVYDLCLAFLGPATAWLRVADIQEVELDLIDKVSAVSCQEWRRPDSHPQHIYEYLLHSAPAGLRLM